MKQVNKAKKLHKITKLCAVFGALFCFLGAITLLIEAVLLLPTISDFVTTLSKAALIIYVAWCFWYVSAVGKNPLKIKPFSRWSSDKKF